MNREADSSEEDNRRDEQIVRNNRLIYYSKINDWEKSVQLLNKKGNLDINCKDESEWTPLHFACFNKNI
jgi:ankyrin repeat protein